MAHLQYLDPIVFTAAASPSLSILDSHVKVDCNAGSGSYTAKLVLDNYGKSARIRIFATIATNANATLEVHNDSATGTTLFTATVGSSAAGKTGLLEFIHNGSAWVAAGPNTLA